MCPYKELQPDKLQIKTPLDHQDVHEPRYCQYFSQTFIVRALVTFTCLFCLYILIRPDPLLELQRMQDKQFETKMWDYFLNLEAREKVISCYYNAAGPTDKHALLPLNIQPQLCTHINIAFASIVNKQIKLDENLITAIKALVSKKKDFPGIKILLSIGGSSDDNGFSEMVKNHTNRKVFIKSIKSILTKYQLDGVDLDWEFPGVDTLGEMPDKRQRQHFTQLLREIKSEYAREKRDYLLTVAVAAPEIIVDAAYDVDQFNKFVNYVNVMTYDYHFFSKYTPFTGLNSPLYALPSERLYMATLNINYTVNMYLAKGLHRGKIVVGIPTYGHSFALVNPNNPTIGSPASGFGSLGHSGFVDFTEVCLYVSRIENTTVVRENSTKVPYLYNNDLWVSYDDPESVIAKVNYIKKLDLRGAMIYSLNADDHLGICDGDLGLGNHLKFPLLQAINAAMDEDNDTLSLEDIKQILE